MSSSRKEFFTALEFLKEESKNSDILICPCCDHKHKVRKFPIDAKRAAVLYEMYIRVKKDWIHVPSFRAQYGCLNQADLKHWNLIQEATKTDIPKEKWGAGKSSGYWRVTDFGEQVLINNAQFPKFAHIYSNQAYAHSGPMITIADCFNEHFSFDNFIIDSGKIPPEYYEKLDKQKK